MDLIHPGTKADVAGAMRAATDGGVRVLVVGGRTHLDRGNEIETDAELWTTQLDRVVAYEPAEMVAVVEAGLRVGELDRILADGGQEWPCDAPPEATVGGVLASAHSSPRRLRVGALRDSVLEVELVTGDGRLVRSGGRTVKNVTGYDLHKLVVGSLGTLGVVVQVALKLRPRPKARRTLRAEGDGLELGSALLAAVPSPTAVLATSTGVELRLEGWPEEVDEQAELASAAVPSLRALEPETGFPARTPWTEAPVVVEAAVPPSRIPAVAEAAGGPWGALLGVGIVWCGLPDAEDSLARVRARVGELGGIAPVIRGPGGLGDGSLPAAGVHASLKASFDPANVLAPGRFWGGA